MSSKNVSHQKYSRETAPFHVLSGLDVVSAAMCPAPLRFAAAATRERNTKPSTEQTGHLLFPKPSFAGGGVPGRVHAVCCGDGPGVFRLRCASRPAPRCHPLLQGYRATGACPEKGCLRALSCRAWSCRGTQPVPMRLWSLQNGVCKGRRPAQKFEFVPAARTTFAIFGPTSTSTCESAERVVGCVRRAQPTDAPGRLVGPYDPAVARAWADRTATKKALRLCARIGMTCAVGITTSYGLTTGA